MAKKAKIKKTKKRKRREPLFTVEPQCDPGIQFSKEVRSECETVRFLGHHVVDRLCDTGRHDWLAGTLGVDLAALCEDVIRNYVTDLIDETRATRKKGSKKRREVLRDSTRSVTESADAKRP